MVKRQIINKTPETQRLANKKTFQDENITVQPEQFSNAILAEQKIKSPIKSPLRKKNTNINVVTFNPATKSYLKMLKSKPMKVLMNVVLGNRK